MNGSDVIGYHNSAGHWFNSNIKVEIVDGKKKLSVLLKSFVSGSN